MVNEDGLLEWWDEKRHSNSNIKIGGSPVCHVRSRPPTREEGVLDCSPFVPRCVGR